MVAALLSLALGLVQAQGMIRIESNTQVDGDFKKGKAVLTLARVRLIPDDGKGWVDRYLDIDGSPEDAFLSFYAIVCHAGRLLAYKSFSLRLAEISGSFEAGEMLVTGAAARLWLARHARLLARPDGGSFSSGEVCGEEFRGARRERNVLHLPPADRAGFYQYQYEPAKQRLDIRWKR